ncbi:MAG: Formamidopyrimidine-DNA glycosylase [Parcubacteria group bacterium GW2011_GWF1_40_6]|uniref:DNA-(apurinic or apyrimidinic site) lyase n=1 Tax=Candidatus Nomurabacteria bacterium GW2011_GWF2_40_12 TaxID=1618776 RepID=A0A0G0R0G3_9BACT|nr:MAG: Formamidopyrimidine-DNA glycosylase [Candidatus Nomurabacteria bacterium GW2011_GWF2_40_12]KKR67243.1 MAG: Formamidopyrimidine-DNA glycosylase [Parcubacteria group bacterium GW2011_GWF1_40_6]
MDQSVIAGIGNIYSDEILWRTGVHPERKVSSLKGTEIKLIFKAIKETLTKGIDFGGDSMSDYRNIHGLPGKFQLHHEVYRRTGEKCNKRSCAGIIKRKIVNGRSAHFCSVHQK